MLFALIPCNGTITFLDPPRFALALRIMFSDDEDKDWNFGYIECGHGDSLGDFDGRYGYPYYEDDDDDDYEHNYFNQQSHNDEEGEEFSGVRDGGLATPASPATATRVGGEILRLWPAQQMQATQRREDEGLRRSLEAAIELRWPNEGLTLRAFGSTVTGLGIKSSDLDLVLLDPTRPNGRWTREQDCKKPRNTHVPFFHPEKCNVSSYLPEWYDVDVLEQALSRAKGVREAQAIHANVPIVKLKIRSSSGRLHEVDVSVNNLFSVHNTDLLKCYVGLRPLTLPPLYFGIRHWLKQRGLNDSTGHQTGVRTLSSYAIVLLVVAFMQSCNELPNLQHPALLARLPASQRKKYRDAYEPMRTTADSSRLEYPAIWDVGFVNVNKHLEYLVHYEQGKVRALLKPDWPERSTLPPFGDWLARCAELKRQKPALQHLPGPVQLGMYKKDKDDIALDVGRLFLGFIDWLHEAIERRSIVDIASSEIRIINTRPAGLDTHHRASARSNTSTRPGNDRSQPLDWADRDFVVADPFIKHRNVIGGMPRGAMRRFKDEVQRAVRIHDLHWHRFSYDQLTARRY